MPQYLMYINKELVCHIEAYGALMRPADGFYLSVSGALSIRSRNWSSFGVMLLPSTGSLNNICQCGIKDFASRTFECI